MEYLLRKIYTTKIPHKNNNDSGQRRVDLLIGKGRIN